ncbi:MAG: 2-oxo acid dehydrogenase subunit E2, partial [Chloroflexi bacterium]|nr:2-oxo acid dehydrogenase subunit E2 [Chloroflexota bacterium]
RATPGVRKLAREHGIDLAAIAGTGLNGRVTRQDIEAAIASGGSPAAPAAEPSPRPAAGEPQPTAGAQVVTPRPVGPSAAPLAGDTPIALSQMRKAIAKNMVYAWSAPHAHAVMEVDMTAVQRYRARHGAEFAAREGFDLSPAAFILKAAAEALRAVPLANSSWTGDGISLHNAINLGYAVALGDEGLVVPVIRDADGRSVAGLMRAVRDVVDRAKARTLGFEDFAGGTFTVNNTGPLGTLLTSPIVPPGQAAIVASDAIVKRAVVTEDEAIAIRSMMNLVIGFDHRVVDGATAAKVLRSMRDWLQGVNDSVPLY